MNADPTHAPLLPQSVSCSAVEACETSEPVTRFLARFGSGAVVSADDEKTRLQKQLLTVGVSIAVVFAFAGAAMVWPRQPLAGVLLAGNGVCLALALGLFVAFKTGIRLFAWAIIVQSLFFIFGSTLAMGGFVASGADPLWAGLAPLTAILFLGTRAFLVTFAMFTAGVVATILYPMAVDLPTPPLHEIAPHLLFNVVGLTTFLFSVVAWFVTQRENALKLLGEERARTERLLLEVLPAEVADRLKQGDASIAHHPSVTVLFADLVGFTPLSVEAGPERMVNLLAEVFHEFDVLVEKHGLEKIKTIGDCYMVASGVPAPREDHAVAMSRFALELRELVRTRTFGGRQLVFRIGMHSGPVIAGVIGRKRFLYDLWGDTVNTASRMEQHGVPGEVQLSDSTRQLLGDAFQAESRGEVSVKGKGEMQLFLLRGEVGTDAETERRRATA